MAKTKKIGSMQIVDNKEDKFFCFPMISMPCTGSGYTKRLIIIRFSAVFILLGSQKAFPSSTMRITFTRCLFICSQILLQWHRHRYSPVCL